MRWTGALKTILGDEYYIIEGGLNGRTTDWDDPLEDYRNGEETLIPCLLSLASVDPASLMLRSNDQLSRFHASAFNINRSAGILLEIIQNGAAE